MEAFSLHYLALPPRPFCGGNSLLHHNKMGFKGVMKRGCTKISVSKRDSYGDNLVDENMIVLRKRIHEMKMLEKNYEPPSNWMEWEKRYYANYDSDICEAMGFLQSKLMDTRPSLVLAMVILIILSVPTSVAVVMFHLVSLLK